MSFQSDWEELCTFLNKWYYKPDTEGLRIILCTYLSHFYLSSPPVWLMIIGQPGSGKTEIGIRPISSLNSVESITRLTINSFISGFGDNNGILSRLPKLSDNTQNGIITFPDLTTTLLSEDYISRTKIMGEMRTIYDGDHSKNVGNKGKVLSWKGKLTCIAACTPDIEEHWAMFRDMGERWLSIRWNGAKPLISEETRIVYKYSLQHEGHEKEIGKGLFNRISNLINNAGSGPEKSVENIEMQSLAILLEESRVNVNRTVMGSRQEVTGVGNKQFITRSAKCINMICKASAALRRSDKIEDIDIQLGKRIAIESIPSKRWKAIQLLISLYPSSCTKKEFVIALGLSKGAANRLIEDLRYLNIINAGDTIDEDDIVASKSDKDLLNTPYGYKAPIASATIELCKDYAMLLTDCKLLPSLFSTESSTHL